MPKKKAPPAKKVAKKAAKKAAPVKAKPVVKTKAKPKRQAAPKWVSKDYKVELYNTQILRTQVCELLVPPTLGHVFYVTVKGAEVRAVVTSLSPLRALLDPIPNSKGARIL
jgi:hypothetical protein